MYQSSPYFKEYAPKLEEELQKSQKQTPTSRANPFYNIKAARQFLKKHLAYAPFIIKFFSGHGNTAENWTRPNNGGVERYNRMTKDDVRKNIGPLGCVGFPRYLHRLEHRLINVDYKRVILSYGELPYKNQRRCVKEKEAYAKHKKAKSKPTLFFFNDGLVRRVELMHENKGQEGSEGENGDIMSDTDNEVELNYSDSDVRPGPSYVSVLKKLEHIIDSDTDSD